MEVTRFTDEFDAVAVLHGVSAEELRARDGEQPNPVQRWVAIEDEEAIGAVTAWFRPDDRTFLRFVGADPAVHRPLTEAVVATLGRSVYTFVDADDVPAVEALRSAGFEVDLVEEAFRIRFDQVLALVDRAWIPKGLSLHQADEVDEHLLFELDNTIRRDTPGTEGWQGDPRWFHEEFADTPPFDPSAYLVAVDDQSGEYVGLIRVWRNPSGPRLGLIGVVRQHRGTPLAAALLKAALTAASGWGYDSFTAETSLTNGAVYPRLHDLADESLGKFFQMVRR